MPKPSGLFIPLMAMVSGLLMALSPALLFPGAAQAHPEVTEMREKGKVSVEPHFEYSRMRRKVKGTRGDESVTGRVREREAEGELEVKYGLLDNLQLEVEVEGVFSGRERTRLTIGDEREEEKEEERGLGDTTVGLTLRILEEGEEGPRPTWVAGIAVKLPSGPSQEAIEKEIENGQVTNKGRKGDAGEGNTNVIFRTAVSKEIGRVEPFSEFKYTIVGDRKITGGRIENGDQLQVTAGADLGLVEKLILRGQFEYLRTGERTVSTETRTVTDSRNQYTLRGEAVWEPAENIEVRPFGGYVWEGAFERKNPSTMESLRFRDNRGWFVGIAFMWVFPLMR